jgi:hypothetical protein
LIIALVTGSITKIEDLCLSSLLYAIYTNNYQSPASLILQSTVRFLPFTLVWGGVGNKPDNGLKGFSSSMDYRYLFNRFVVY